MAGRTAAASLPGSGGEAGGASEGARRDDAEPVLQRPPRRTATRYGLREALTPAQARALSFVLEEPGATIRRIAVQLRVTHATASYHLGSLARLGLVAQLRDGREVLQFPGDKVPPAGLYVAALSRDERKLRILRLLARMPPQRWTLHQLCGKAGTSFGLLKRTLRQLEWAKLVVLERRRFRYSIQVSDDLRTALQSVGAAPEATMEAAPDAEEPAAGVVAQEPPETDGERGT